MQVKSFKPIIWLTVLVVVISLACNLGGSGTSELVPVTESPAKPSPTEAEPPPKPQHNTISGAVSGLQDVKNAVIQIEAQGTFINPDFSVAYNAAGLGSGFIIDPSGIAVTNNHVVTGAGLLKVWVGGDQSRTYNAKILGVSECSDLAVIDIEGDGFSYLDWHEGPIGVGLEVYAAGFPLGEPQFTLTKGIVSKEQAGGETSWASVDYVIEHDATINPGNSGGPLVDEDGKIVGVNYRGRTTNQYFAIGRDLVTSLVAQLRVGQDVNTFGINGEAFASDDFSGIWVYSVKSGSPADDVGIKGGDIITTLEDLILATDGTMADYCDILRSHNSTDTMNVEVLRYATEEVLQGQINGRALEPAFTFGQALDDQVASNDVAGDNSGSTDVQGYSEYVMAADDDGSIQMSIPAEWTDIDGSRWETDWGGDEFVAASIAAAGDLDAYYNSYGESGVFFAASDRLSQLGGYVELLDGTRYWYEEDCILDSRNDYVDSAYEGQYDLWTDCGAEGGVVLTLSARPINDTAAFLILVEVTLAKDTDLDALDEILATFDVVGPLP
jgi:serine protease Do